MRETLGGLNVRLKKSLVNPGMAYKIFCEELNKYKEAVIAEGRLHFNFVSDPCLPETIELNWKCIDYAISQKVPCQVLTKRADWLGHPSVQNALTNHPELLLDSHLQAAMNKNLVPVRMNNGFLRCEHFMGWEFQRGQAVSRLLILLGHLK